MLTVLAFMKAHWRPIVFVVAVVLAYGAGRFGTPPKVITDIQVITQTVTKTETKTVQAEAKVIYRDRVVDRVIKADGSQTIHSETKTHEADQKEAASQTDQTVQQSQAVTQKTTVVSDAPRLTVNLLVGATIKPAWQPIPGAGPLALGAQVTYRIAGPVTVGAWGLDTGSFGASVGAQF